MSAIKKSVQTLYSEFKAAGSPAPKAEKIEFIGAQDNDVYNIAAPFELNGKQVIAGRVEARDSEHSTVMFFEQTAENQFTLLSDAPTFELQDPFYTYINGEFIFGGVEISPDPDNADALIWKTCFYRGPDIYSLTHFVDGPARMKDIRLCATVDNKIMVFTRPQGEIGGRGTIGVTQIDSLEDLSIEVINNAELLAEHFEEQDWGGVNAGYLQDDGKIALLAHVASFDDNGGRHYYPSTFLFDPADNSYSSMRIIAERSQFKAGESKRADLVDVVFSGGLVHIKDDLYRLYVGTSDCEAQWIEINQPFLQQ
ncbi:DUF1861 family protein [Psychromonas aquimarina]|uniref:DUF1861 family protein n=1 Tax=Psychromonas aquimarina TaxID=444919 RepID=UPI00041995AC|nr:DUF1861 family protein [Psychromonas aquimarina]